IRDDLVTGVQTCALPIWNRGAQGYAARDRRYAQQGSERGPRRSEAQGAACGARRRADADDARPKLIADETEKWAKVVKFSGAKADRKSVGEGKEGERGEG